MSRFYDIHMIDLGGKALYLNRYKGKVLLVVNIASKCGFTKQLKGLQKLYERYKDKGFAILAVPSNDFWQEPLQHDKLGDFCQKNYGVTFDVSEKVSVRGKNKHQLYQFFQDQGQASVKWNFYKTLVNQDATSFQTFNSVAKPEKGKLEESLKKMLK